MRTQLWSSLVITSLALISCKSAPTWFPFSSSSSALPRAEPLPQDPIIQVYFNQNLARNADYTDLYRQIERPGDDLETLIIEAINQAQSSLDVAVQEIRLPRIAQALIAQHQAGVSVRVIIENTYNQPWSEREPSSSGGDPAAEFRMLADQNQDGQLSAAEIAQADAIVMLRNAGVPLIDDTADGSKGSGLMHHKFMLVDGIQIVTGSANWTLSGIHGDMDAPASRGNANNLLVVQHPILAQAFAQEFNFMWGDGPGGRNDSLFGLQKPPRSPQILQVGSSTVTLNFSPLSPTQPWQHSTNGVIGRALQQAQSQVDLALFVFSEQPLANILRD
ncbi:MAG: competence protein ComE, partial [Spirulina sp. SIO3F2]|nr:competence protein ComE [Spirulina sp. SIO3F2]